MNKYNIIEFTNQEEYKKEFLDLPKRLYKKKEIMQKICVLNLTAQSLLMKLKKQK